MKDGAMDGTRLWSVVPQTSAARNVGGKGGRLSLRDHAEWLRMFVGRSLALAQPSGPDRWEFFVPGTPCEEWRDLEREQLEAIHQAVLTDFAGLLEAMSEMTRRLHKADPVRHCETILYGFAPLALLRLPDDPSCWRVTDEGLSIVDWGGEDGIVVFGRDVNRSVDRINEIARECLDRVAFHAQRLGRKDCEFAVPSAARWRSEDRTAVYEAHAGSKGKAAQGEGGGRSPGSGNDQRGNVGRHADSTSKARRPGPILIGGLGLAAVLVLVITFFVGFKIGRNRAVDSAALSVEPATEPSSAATASPETEAKTDSESKPETEAEGEAAAEPESVGEPTPEPTPESPIESETDPDSSSTTGSETSPDPAEGPENEEAGSADGEPAAPSADDPDTQKSERKDAQ